MFVAIVRFPKIKTEQDEEFRDGLTGQLNS
jgi:hypothetical protein